MAQYESTVLAAVRNAVGRNPSASSGKDLADLIRSERLAYGETAITELATTARHEMYGAGPLQRYLDNPQVTDVLVNGYDSAWIDRGQGLERVPSGLTNDEQLRALAVRLAAQAGSRLDDSSPTVDGRLLDGTRLHALLAPVSESPALISLRTLRQQAINLPELVDSGTIPAQWEPVLRAVVDKRLNFLVSGATGTGKTTLLSTLLSLVPPSERIITIEESREIRPDHPHVIALETKKANVEGRGAIGQSELLRNALRMRPDRIVVGECRGGELAEMLSALNTGHEGGCGTIHANSTKDVPARLHALGALSAMTPEAVTLQAASALDLVLHVRREPHPTWTSARYVEEIALLEHTDSTLRTRTALSWHNRSEPTTGPGYAELLERLR